MAEGEEWKTAFRCRYGLFEFRVMLMGLIKCANYLLSHNKSYSP